MWQLSLLILLFSSVSMASRNLHFRTGTVAASMSAANSESFSVAPTLEGEYEYFYRPNGSLGIRSTLGMRSSDGKVLYFGTLLGQRYYFGGSGYNSVKTLPAGSISRRKNLRTFVFYDAGFSLVNAKSLGDLFQAISLLLEAGGGIGMNYSISNKLALGFRFSMGYGFGVSSVAVTAITTNISLGANYTF